MHMEMKSGIFQSLQDCTQRMHMVAAAWNLGFETLSEQDIEWIAEALKVK